jgi:hypothetical protein
MGEKRFRREEEEYRKRQEMSVQLGNLFDEHGTPGGDFGEQLGKASLLAFHKGLPELGMSLGTQYRNWKNLDHQADKEQLATLVSLSKTNKGLASRFLNTIKGRSKDPFIQSLTDEDFVVADQGLVFPATLPDGTRIPGAVIMVGEDGKKHFQKLQPESKPPTFRSYSSGGEEITEKYGPEGELLDTYRSPKWKPKEDGESTKPPTRGDIRTTISKTNAMLNDPRNYEEPEEGWPTKGRVDPRGMGLKLRGDVHDEINLMREGGGLGPLRETSKPMNEYWDFGLFRTGGKPGKTSYSYSFEGEGGKGAGEKPAPRKGKPSSSSSIPRSDWMKKARAVNPGVSDKELGEYYDQKYGGGR